MMLMKVNDTTIIRVEDIVMATIHNEEGPCETELSIVLTNNQYANAYAADAKRVWRALCDYIEKGEGRFALSQDLCKIYEKRPNICTEGRPV